MNEKQVDDRPDCGHLEASEGGPRGQLAPPSPAAPAASLPRLLEDERVGHSAAVDAGVVNHQLFHRECVLYELRVKNVWPRDGKSVISFPASSQGRYESSCVA